MKVFIGSDHAGYEVKEKVKELLDEMGIEYEDLGAESMEPSDYPDYAYAVADEVLANKAIGILICGTGIGMSIAANRREGVRAALCYNEESAKVARSHNNANICVLGARTTDWEDVKKIVTTFLDTDFSEEERHRRRVNKIP